MQAKNRRELEYATYLSLKRKKVWYFVAGLASMLYLFVVPGLLGSRFLTIVSVIAVLFLIRAIAFECEDERKLRKLRQKFENFTIYVR